MVFDIKDSDGSSASLSSTQVGAQRYHPQFAQVRPLPALAASACDRAHRDFPGSAPGAGLSRTRRAFPEERAALARNGKLAWTDPSQPEVQQYNIALARRPPPPARTKSSSTTSASLPKAIRRMPVRIPDGASGVAAPQGDRGLRGARGGDLHPTGVLLSLDVFGVMAWARPVDLDHTGQNIVSWRSTLTCCRP